MAMADYLPNYFGKSRFAPLPPGTEVRRSPFSDRSGRNILTVLYVGGVEPPIHDILPLLQASQLLRDDRRIRFVICCYQSHWEAALQYYVEHGFSPERAENVSVVHLWGEDIHELYVEADLSVMISNPCDYLNIAMPIKVFEALGYGIPIIANERTPFGRFVEDNGTGWAVKPTGEEVATLIMTCVRDRSQLAMKRNQIAKIVGMHTWEARARRVSEILAESAE